LTSHLIEVASVIFVKYNSCWCDGEGEETRGRGRGKKNDIAYLLQWYNLKTNFQENKFEYLESLKFNNINFKIQLILKYNFGVIIWLRRINVLFFL